MLGKTDSKRRRGRQGRRWSESITNSMDEFEQTPGDGAGQGSLVCCSPRGCKELDMKEWLNNNKILKKCGIKV